MTAAALDLFAEVAELASALPSVDSATPARAFPETNFEGGKLLRVVDGIAEYSVPMMDVPICALCTMPITGHFDFTHGACIVIQPDGSTPAIAHHECMVKALGHPNRVQGWRERIVHADCAACGRPWDDHQQYGYETLCCPTWDGGAANVPLYQHAPGHVGPLHPGWLVVAGEEQCSCHTKVIQEAA